MPDRHDPFETTHWSLVLSAAGEGSDAREAMEQLCRIYWQPVLAFVRRRCPSAETAEELVQSFFVQVLERQAWQHADPVRGRFRAFLLTSVRNYLASQYDRQQAERRGGGRQHVSLNAEGAEEAVADPMTPDRWFDRQWALALLDRVLGRLADEHAAPDRQRQFARLKPFLTGDQPRPYAELAAELNSTEQALRAAVYRLRQRYRQLLRQEVARTLAPGESVEDELRWLLTALEN